MTPPNNDDYLINLQISRILFNASNWSKELGNQQCLFPCFRHHVKERSLRRENSDAFKWWKWLLLLLNGGIWFLLRGDMKFSSVSHALSYVIMQGANILGNFPNPSSSYLFFKIKRIKFSSFLKFYPITYFKQRDVHTIMY